jgi:glycosyltransferase involved in cell wall biosynthesis
VKNILLCSPYKGTIGGISRWTHHILDYYSNLVDKDNIQLELFSLSRSKGVYANSSILGRISSGIYDYLLICFRFLFLVVTQKHDVIHIVSSGSLGLLKDLVLLVIICLTGKRSIVHFRYGRIPEVVKAKGWEFLMLFCVIKLARHVIVIDKASFEALQVYAKGKISYLPNPLNSTLLSIISNSNIKRVENSLLFVGHVVPTKGIFELIEATKDIAGIEVKILGACSEEVKKNINIEIEGRSNYTFMGEQCYEETINSMLSCGVFVLPSYTEGFPNVILESMACSCPIIATRVGAIPEMLNINSDASCGICVEPMDALSLRTEILKLIKDSRKKNELGSRARQRVMEEYNMDSIWLELKNIWNKA